MRRLLFLPLFFISFAFGVKNSIGMEFVFIPSGNFMMGCDENGGFCKDDELPRHQVTISKAFYLGKYEVTQKQWEAVMGYNPSKVKGGDLPVTNVSWNDAVLFIKKLNDKESTTKYYLPSEAQWEYAARGGSKTRYFWSQNEGYHNYAWLNADGIQKVGQKKPNKWELYDTAGNVWEWTNDFYNEDYYKYSPAKDPKGPTDGHTKVIKGGSYSDDADFARPSFRYDAHLEGKASSDENIGFRVAMAEYELQNIKIDFDNYYAKIYVKSSESDSHLDGFTAVFEKKTDRKIISVDFKDTYAKNVSLPQFVRDNKLIIYDDFNFDGERDFAIRHTNASLNFTHYVYLSAPQGFEFSKAFSGHTSRGGFDIDKENRKIIVTQSDNGYYYETHYDIVHNDEFKRSKILEKSSDDGVYIKYAETIYDSSETKQKSWTKLDFDAVKTAFSFAFNNGKRAVVFLDGSQNVNYAFLDKNENVEFTCPAHDDESGCADFDFQEKGGKLTLSFTNKDTNYVIYQHNGDFGITIKTLDGKIYDMKGKKGSETGDLKNVLKGKNIAYKSGDDK
jgi:hypothetical protein